jgi:hypothetical protein
MIIDLVVMRGQVRCNSDLIQLSEARKGKILWDEAIRLRNRLVKLRTEGLVALGPCNIRLLQSCHGEGGFVTLQTGIAFLLTIFNIPLSVRKKTSSHFEDNLGNMLASAKLTGCFLISNTIQFFVPFGMA